MFWDASLDQNNIINNKTYSENIAAFMDRKTSLPSKTPVTLQTRPNEETTKTEPQYEVKDESKELKPSHPIHPSKIVLLFIIHHHLLKKFSTRFFL